MDSSNRTVESYQTQFRNTAAMEEPLSPNSDTDMNRRSSDDPFAGQRDSDFKWDPFSHERRGSGVGQTEEVPMTQRDRRMSKEWDASKVPPSRFQKREGSIHATPASRDGHIDRNKLDSIKEKMFNKDKRKSSA